MKWGEDEGSKIVAMTDFGAAVNEIKISKVQLTELRAMENKDEDEAETPTGRWILFNHECSRPDNVPQGKGAGAGSVWQCGECGIKWMWMIPTQPGLYFGKPWTRMKNGEG